LGSFCGLHIPVAEKNPLNLTTDHTDLTDQH
jgi:hypothetical protein